MRIKSTDSYNVEIICKWVLAIIVCLTILEAIIYPESENVYGCFTFIIAWLFLATFVLRQKNAQKCFIPFIALFGIGICFYFLPLPMTMIEGKPLTFRFQCPYITFSYQLLNLVMLIISYRLCLYFYKPTNLLTRLWTKLGYFSAPSDKQIWAMGIIGIASQIILLSVMGTDEALAENLGVVGHLLNVTKVFASFPVLLLFKHLYTGKVVPKIEKRPIFIYLVVLAVLGVATGKRTALFSSFVTLAMCYILPAFTENKRLFSRKSILISIVGIYLITGPVADFAIAMNFGRDNSGKTGANQTFDKILDLYQDKEKLNTMYKTFLMATDNGGDNLSGWSEYYVDNIMLDRFCNLRVCDMTIDYARKLGFDNPTMHEYVSNQVLFQLPTPILNLLGYHLNKFELQYTPGDLLSMESLNIGYYHGYRVAGDVGIGLYLWGEKYFLYGIFIYFIYFFFLSSLVKLSPVSSLIFPLPVLADMFRYFLLFNNATGMVGVLTTILRVGWQAIFVYCLILFFIKKMIK